MNNNLENKRKGFISKIIRIETETTRNAVLRHYAEKEYLDAQVHAAKAQYDLGYPGISVTTLDDLHFKYYLKNIEGINGFPHRREIVLFDRKRIRLQDKLGR